jgi:hypothetical protein
MDGVQDVEKRSGHVRSGLGRVREANQLRENCKE